MKLKSTEKKDGDHWEQVFEWETEDTCKQRWTFKLYKDGDKTVISSIKIDEREKRQGCQGHPQMLQTLIRGVELESLDIDALNQVSCKRDKSCGQILALCLKALREGE